MNFLPVTSVAETDGLVTATAGSAAVPTGIVAKSLPARTGLTLGIRPDALKVVPSGGSLNGAIELVERLGDRTLLHVRLADGGLVVAEDSGKSLLEVGAPVSLAADPSETHLFDADGVAYHSS